MGKRPERIELSINWHVAVHPGKRKQLLGTAQGDLPEQIEHAKACIQAKVARRSGLLLQTSGLVSIAL